MPIDPSIALQVQPLKLDNPLDSAGKALTLKQLMLSTQKEQQGLDDAASLKSIYAQAGSDPKTLSDLLYKGGFGAQALAQQKDALANRNVQSEIDQRASSVAKDKTARAAALTQGFLSLPPDQYPIQYPNLVAQWNAEGLGPKPLENEPFSPSFLPHMQMVANSGLSVKDAQEKQDYANTVQTKPLVQPNIQGTPLDDLPAPPNEAPSPTADQIHPLTAVDAKKPGVSTPDELRAQADALDQNGNKVASDKADKLRTRADSLEARMLADNKDKNELVEIGDPTSPTGSRYVLKSVAAGQPGSRVLSAPKTTIGIKTSEAQNEDFLKNEYNPSRQASETAKSSNNQIQTLRNLDITGKSGWGTETKAKAAAVLATFHIKDAAKYAADAQVFNATAGQKVFELLAAQKGVQTEGDAQRAKQLFVNLQNTPDANKFLLDLAEAANNNAVRKYQYYLQNNQKNKENLSQLEADWANSPDNKSIWDDPIMKKWAGQNSQSNPASDPAIDALIKKYTK